METNRTVYFTAPAEKTAEGHVGFNGILVDLEIQQNAVIWSNVGRYQ